ncbi:MAG: FAD-binding oxidoreductase [Chromatiales bacterium]|nr:FAD-binding oxidoreductase [Chromatiales bacterium]
MAQLDYLIIGQGLAGSLLAWRLMQRGCRVVVVDNGYRNSSSIVAAGLINPVTGKRLAKTVGVDHYLPEARACYRELGQLLGEELLLDKPMLRLFHSEQEREQWQRRREETGYHPYLGEIVEADALPAPLVASHGGGWQRQTAYLRTMPVLHGLRDWLEGQGGYLQGDFHYDELRLTGTGVAWREIEACGVIFCEGYRARENPWFGWLPFQPAKGEFLTLRSDAPLPDLIINSGRWLMPRGNGLYRAGASYDHQQLDESPSGEAREMLLAALTTFLSPAPEFEVVAQQAGVRPTTSDRHPFVGAHPQQPQLMICNGFGSKGSLLIPWHVARFVDHLLQGRALPQTADIHRFVWGGDG